MYPVIALLKSHNRRKNGWLPAPLATYKMTPLLIFSGCYGTPSNDLPTLNRRFVERDEVERQKG
jgi:hypothetical protein